MMIWHYAEINRRGTKVTCGKISVPTSKGYFERLCIVLCDADPGDAGLVVNTHDGHALISVTSIQSVARALNHDVLAAS